MSTFAGMHGRKGFSGDGLDATSAELQSPSHVFVSSWGDVFITDMDNGRIRKVGPLLYNQQETYKTTHRVCSFCRR